MSSEDAALNHIMQKFTENLSEFLNKISKVQLNGLYMSHVLKFLSGSVLTDLQEKLPKVAEILKLFMSYIEKKSLSAQSSNTSETIAKLEEMFDGLSKKTAQAKST